MFLTLHIAFSFCSGGSVKNDGHFGEDGTVTGKKCPMGLYGTFCTVWTLTLNLTYVVVSVTRP